MVFAFSFTVPGISNPFTAAGVASAAVADPAPVPKLHFDTNVQPSSSVSRRRPPSPSLLPPRSRKRGWVPSSSEPSAASIYTSTSGYLDTPAKYRDMVPENADQDEIEELVADLPPPKRRRTLAGSIISTALSAALIGSAVGLTVYRLWRDRGKNPEPLPPPPYEQGEWVPPEAGPSVPPTPSLKPPTTPRSRKSRPVASRRTVPRHRKTPSRHTATASTSHYYGQSQRASRSPIPPEFNFSRSSPKPDEDADVDEQMSWIGDRLAQLIAEGQKALGKEIVVMSEDQADEVDDGSGAWVEDDSGPDARTAGSSRGAGLGLGLGLPPYSPHTPTPQSPTKSRFARGASVDSDSRSIAGSFREREREEEGVWDSPEIRASMERARMLHRQKRGL